LGAVTVTPLEASAIFDEMAALGGVIPFAYPADGCYFRAEDMAKLIEDDGYAVFKAGIQGVLEVETEFIYGETDPQGRPLDPRNRLEDDDGTITWGWHIAPALIVDTGAGFEIQVIDPSLAGGPVSPAEWAAIMGQDRNAVEPLSRDTYGRYSDGSWYEGPDSGLEANREVYLDKCQRAGYC